MYKIFKLDKFSISTIILTVFIYIYPSSLVGTLNGLPFTNLTENIFLFIFFPLIFLIPNFFRYKTIKFLVFILFLIKIILLFSPRDGIGHKLYFTDGYQGNYIQTYNSIWDQNYSSIQKSKWLDKQNFPIDWVSNTDKIENSNNPYYYYSKDDFKKLNFRLNSNFDLILNEDATINFNLPINSIKKLSIKNLNKLNKIETLDQNIRLDKGKYSVEIIFLLKGEEFIFNPMIIYKNGIEKSVFDEKIVFLNSNNITFAEHNFYKILSKVFDVFIYFFLVLIVFIISNYFLKNKHVLYIVSTILALFMIASILLSSITLNEQILNYKYNLSLSLSFLVLIFLFFFVPKYKKYKIFFFKNENLNYFLCFILPLILIGILKNINELEGLSWWVPGDDGHTYQKFAREIIVDKQWLHSNTIYRQAPMYIFGFFHVLFGQSGFSQKIIEFFVVGLICFLTFKIIKKIIKENNLSLFSSLTLLIVFTGEKYTSFIGKGYTEYYAAFLIMLSVYLIQKYRLNIYIFLILFIFSLLGLGLREDHIFVIFAIIFYSISIKIENKSNLYLNFYSTLKKNFNKIFLYGIIVILSFVFLMLRNYYADPNSIEKIVDHPNLIMFKDIFNHPSFSRNNSVDAYLDETILHSYYRMFFGSEPFKFPRLTSFILFPAFVLTILNLIMFKTYSTNSLGTTLSIIGVLIPYLFIVNHGYEPRYTIHYLPFCLIIISEHINQLRKKNKFKSIFDFI